MLNVAVAVVIVLLAVVAVVFWQRLALLEEDEEDARTKLELAAAMSEVYAQGVAAGQAQERRAPRWDDYQDFADEVVGRMRAQLLWRQLNQPGFGLGLPRYGRRHRRRRDGD